MVEKMESLSVAELQQILGRQQRRVQQLQKRREKLIASVAEIDQEINGLTGGESGVVRFKNAQSLEAVIREVLSKYKKGLTLSELTEAVEKTGYQSASANFRNVVYQNVYKAEDITRDEKTKKYMLV